MKRKITILLLILITPLLIGASYNYSYYGEVLHSSPGYNYITHFDQQSLYYKDTEEPLRDDHMYADPQEIKVYDDKVYMLTKNKDRDKDLLFILDLDFRVIDVIEEFELTKSYQEKVDKEVDNVFSIIESIFDEIFTDQVFYPGTVLPVAKANNELLPEATFTWTSDDLSLITNDGIIGFNFTDEIQTTNINLEIDLLGHEATYTFPVSVGHEIEGIEASSGVFSYNLEETLSVSELNEAINTNFDASLYDTVLELIDINLEYDEDGELELDFEYEGYKFSFTESAYEDAIYDNITITKVEDGLGEESDKIHSSMFDPIYTTNRAKGLDVVESGVYIADTENNRIVKLNHDFEVIDAFYDVEDETFDDLTYRPQKIAVDTSERMYVIADSVYEGIIELDSNGEFNRFTGVNPIQLTPAEILRRFLMTEAQQAKLPKFLPTRYSSLALNDKSFIFATAKPREDNAENMIQLINPKGIDVLKRNGYHTPMGDIMYIDGRNNYVIDGPSDLVDIAVGKDGIYSVLDTKRSRIFTYDREGNLLYVNGDKGNQSDKFNRGISLEYIGDNLVVLDEDGTLIVYRPTEFGETVNKAVSYYNIGEFEKSAKEWEKVLTLNTNYEVAYNGIGKYNLREGDFKEAMKNFKLGHDRYYYSKAFKSQRNLIIKKHFAKAVIGILVVVVGYYAYDIGKKVYIKKKGDNQ